MPETPSQCWDGLVWQHPFWPTHLSRINVHGWENIPEKFLETSMVVRMAPCGKKRLLWIQLASKKAWPGLRRRIAAGYSLKTSVLWGPQICITFITQFQPGREASFCDGAGAAPSEGTISGYQQPGRESLPSVFSGHWTCASTPQSLDDASWMPPWIVARSQTDKPVSPQTGPLPLAIVLGPMAASSATPELLQR